MVSDVQGTKLDPLHGEDQRNLFFAVSQSLYAEGVSYDYILCQEVSRGRRGQLEHLWKRGLLDHLVRYSWILCAEWSRSTVVHLYVYQRVLKDL